MNKYFVVSDVHGFYNEMCEALDAAGYDPTNSSHWLISCGDNFDRGPENFKVMQYFLRQPRCILVRGNHEDLLDYACTEGISMRDYPNGTVNTIEELGANTTRLDWTMDDKMDLTFKRTRGFFDRMVDFYETKNYVFVHGWIPSLKLYPDWRKAPTSAWEKARWENGMKAAHSSHLDPAGKTIVCGHYHTSWGHHIQSGTPEWGEGSDFRIYRDKGIIAIDGCTAYTGKVNVLVIEDEPLEDCNSTADYSTTT